VSEVTYYRWRQEFGGLKTEQVKRLTGVGTSEAVGKHYLEEKKVCRYASRQKTLRTIVLNRPITGSGTGLGVGG
jgi:hypothetical protein